MRARIADISPNIVVNLIELARQRGLSSDSWFGGLALNRTQLADPSVRISYRQARTLVQRALAALREPNLGLLIGLNESIRDFGVLGLAMSSSRTLGEAMQVGVDLHKVCGSLLDLKFTTLNARTVAIQAFSNFGEIELLPFLCEEMFSSSLVLVRELIGPQFIPIRVEVSYAAPPYAADYTRIFRCPIHFGARENRVLIEAHWLEKPLPTSNPLTSRQCLELCTQQLASQSVDDEIVGAVSRLLRDRLNNQPRLTEIAHRLNLSERSLRRRLAKNGRAFSEIQDQVRSECALELLRTDMSLTDIGLELGFSDSREFRRAFKRWTGMPPQVARRARLTSTDVV